MDQRGYLPLLVVALGLVLMPPVLLGPDPHLGD